jgi:hypothetical protein
MKRREFLTKSAMLSGAAFLPGVMRAVASEESKAAQLERYSSCISFQTSDPHYQAIYSQALEALARNTATVSGYSQPVLTEGSSYYGIWLECAPQEGLAYSAIRPDVARNNHQAFFALRREDGQIPCWIRSTAVGFGQIQMVVPIAATAWELSQANGDNELLKKAYSACSRWDAWLRRYRDTRRTGLCEGFCAWDTGHDNSPRWAGIPNSCPAADARKCPPISSLPRLCPDLSASVYGGRVALAAMARALGKNSESDGWLADAGAIRSAIFAKLYSAEDASFYDLDAQGRFVRIRSDVISRVLGEHVVDPTLFATIYERQIHNREAFWPAYPLPSIALNDAAFVRPIPRNSWGGASQALTALRAPRWMERYGKPSDLAYLMQQWIFAILREGRFLQQMDPLDGQFTPDLGDYSPAALILVDFTWRLAGVRQDGDLIEWNIRPPAPGVCSSYELRLTPTAIAELKYKSGRGELILNGKLICATSSTVRLVTDQNGKFKKAAAISPRTITVELQHASGVKHSFSIAPNASVQFDGR